MGLSRPVMGLLYLYFYLAYRLERKTCLDAPSVPAACSHANLHVSAMLYQTDELQNAKLLYMLINRLTTYGYFMYQQVDHY
jgi:hypothetical protein